MQAILLRLLVSRREVSKLHFTCIGWKSVDGRTHPLLRDTDANVTVLPILFPWLQIHAGHLHGGQQRTISISIFFLLYSCIAYLVDSNVPNLCFSSFSSTVAVTCGSPIWWTTTYAFDFYLLSPLQLQLHAYHLFGGQRGDDALCLYHVHLVRLFRRVLEETSG